MTTDPLTAFVGLLANAVAERVADMQPEPGFEGPMLLSIPDAAKRVGVGPATMRDCVQRPDALQALPRLLAQHAEKAWAEYRRENANSVLASWSDGWEDGFSRTAHGIPGGVDRLRGLGNAVVPQVIEWIGHRILEAEQQLEEAS